MQWLAQLHCSKKVLALIPALFCEELAHFLVCVCVRVFVLVFAI